MILASLAACLFGIACSDPPPPPPVVQNTGSSSAYVEWANDRTPVTQPLAVFTDAPGGPADKLTHNADVATFLNDRFHPIFLTLPGTAPSIRFYTADGCPLTEALLPRNASDLIDIANRVIVMPDATGHQAARFPMPCPRPAP